MDGNVKKDADKVEEIYKNNSILYLCLQNEYFNIVLKRTKNKLSKEEVIVPKILIDKKGNLFINENEAISQNNIQ